MANLRVHNSLTGVKETFIPREGRKVRMYACGPTVYDLSHLGHARMAVVWDTVARYLRYSKYEVTFVRNITDVDDKIIKRAGELGLTPEQVAREYIFQFWKDMRALNVAAPDYEPRATEYMAQMIEFVRQLIEKGHAYEVDGDVYFSVESFPQHGKLRKQNIADQIIGARSTQIKSQAQLKERKRNPIDFALWKGVAAGEHGWNSPWGRGRPGWHIECSAMIKHVLGDETIDIHAGGEDLIFPHHENEIAQSESLHGHDLAKYWLHNSFVQVNKEKMGKSLGNFRTIQDMLALYSADTLRLYLLQTHYRSPIDFGAEGLDGARNAVQKLIRAAHVMPNTDGSANADESLVKALKEEFVQAMDDDFNTPRAIALLHKVADATLALSSGPAKKTESDVERDLRLTQAHANQVVLKEIAGVLGLTLADTRREVSSDTARGAIDLLLALRETARANKDWATSDEIRNQLLALGVRVMDGGKTGPTTWEIA